LNFGLPHEFAPLPRWCTALVSQIRGITVNQFSYAANDQIAQNLVESAAATPLTSCAVIAPPPFWA
jgi:hypothetical protein